MKANREGPRQEKQLDRPDRFIVVYVWKLLALLLLSIKAVATTTAFFIVAHGFARSKTFLTNNSQRKP